MNSRLWKRWRPGDHPRARWLLLAPAVTAMAVVGGACGGDSAASDGVATAAGNGASSSSGKVSDSRKRDVDPQQAGLDFARCMREHGVDVPDPEPGQGGLVRIGPGPAPGQGGDMSAGLRLEGGAFEEAHEACRHFLDDLIQDGDFQIDPKEQDRALKHAQCMREHGIDMPDPQFHGGSISVKIEGIDPTSQAFKDAQKACGGLFGPSEGPGVGPRAGRGPS